MVDTDRPLCRGSATGSLRRRHPRIDVGEDHEVPRKRWQNLGALVSMGDSEAKTVCNVVKLFDARGKFPIRARVDDGEDQLTWKAEEQGAKRVGTHI